MSTDQIANIISRLQLQSDRIQQTNPHLMDALTIYDLDKALRQFSANVDRAIEDADRRFLEGRMVL